MVRKLCIALLVTAVATQTASAQTGKGGILNRMKGAIGGSQRSASSAANRSSRPPRTTHKSSYRSGSRKAATDADVQRAVAVATGRLPATPTSATIAAPQVKKPVQAPTPARVAAQVKPAAAPQVPVKTVAFPNQVSVQAVPMTRLAPTPDQAFMPQRLSVHTAGFHQMSYGDAMPMGGYAGGGQYPQTSAAMYPTPQPNIPYQVGMTQITNPAFAPHEMLYAHQYRAIYPPYYYKVRGGWLMTPFGVWSHENWKPVGREVTVKYRSRISPFSGFIPPNN